MNPLISVIVVNYNRGELLRQCLMSFMRQTYPFLEVLVVENGSSDGSLAVVRSFTDERIRLFALDRNAGFAEGSNIASREARGEFIALINNDAVASGGYIKLQQLPAYYSPIELVGEKKTADKMGGFKKMRKQLSK